MHRPRLIVEGREGPGALRVPLQREHAGGYLTARRRLGLSTLSTGVHAGYKCSDEVRRALCRAGTPTLVINPVAADVRRRRRAILEKNPPPHVGGYHGGGRNQ